MKLDLDSLAKKTERRIQEWLTEGEKVRQSLLAAGRADTPPNENLDPWQKQAVDALLSGQHVVVDAPTTAGKTRVVEAFFHTFLHDINYIHKPFRAVYTTPVKSLSNDKVREMRTMFGEKNVGISTGDIKENLNAPIIIATLESYRNSLLGTEPDLGRTLAIFDEYHFLQDESRGTAWEEAIILSPESCQLLLLSASVGNPEDFVDWIGKIRSRPCVLVQTLERPVPLTDLVFVDKNWIHADLLPPKFFQDFKKNNRPSILSFEEVAQRLPSVLNLNLGPSILYAGKRLSCENLARTIARKLPPFDPQKRVEIGEQLTKLHAEIGCLAFIKNDLRQLIQSYGVSYHHSGLPAPARIAIETLVKHGLLRFCTATMGLSIGINFSVRSTMITDLIRPGELGPVEYSPSEVLQMLGRAGRRGKDAVGFSLWPNVTSFIQMGRVKREPCTSRLKQEPTTFLGLVGRKMSIGAIENLYGRSFRKHQDRNFDLRLIQKAHVMNKLNVKEIPCESPAAEVTRFWLDDKKSLCWNCPYQKKCHAYVEFRGQSDLSLMHMHLHSIGTLSRNDELTAFGMIARFLPQAGGLLVAKHISQDDINEENFNKYLELMASLCLVGFKEPKTSDAYQYPFKEKNVVEDLKNLYPEDLFGELYDRDFNNRGGGKVYKEFNPRAGWIIREWNQAKIPWSKFQAEIVTEYFGEGDVMALIYRTATLLQSIRQADLGTISELAFKTRENLLRPPLDIKI